MLSVQSYLDSRFSIFNKKRMVHADSRSKKINEIISGIKIIKFNAWEKFMNQVIRVTRAKECALILKAFLYSNISQGLTSLIPTICGLVVFSVYDATNTKKLNVSQIYELVTFFNALAMPVRYYIMGFMGRLDAIVCADRISKIIKMDPIKPLEDDEYLNPGEIVIQNGNFNWEDPKYFKMFKGEEMSTEKRNIMILKDINLEIKRGDFVAVVGKVGSGKSSLIYALMDEMVRQTGIVKKNGKIAFVSQEAFLQNDTIRDNVVFGLPFDKAKFDECLDICQMGPDLEILPGREMTEIGERGINMSGGQKQRINIARAVYSDSDVYLIDDALSALDAYVGKKIMDLVFKGKLGEKTRVMVTHYLHLLAEVDKVILMADGEIKAYGTYEEVKATEAFQEFVKSQKTGDGAVLDMEDGDDDQDPNERTPNFNIGKNAEISGDFISKALFSL